MQKSLDHWGSFLWHPVLKIIYITSWNPQLEDNLVSLTSYCRRKTRWWGQWGLFDDETFVAGWRTSNEHSCIFNFHELEVNRYLGRFLLLGVAPWTRSRWFVCVARWASECVGEMRLVCHPDSWEEGCVRAWTGREVVDYRACQRLNMRTTSEVCLWTPVNTGETGRYRDLPQEGQNVYVV